MNTVTDQLAADEVEEPAEGVADCGDAQPVDDAPTEVAVAPTGRLRRFRRVDRVSKWDRPPDPHDWRFWVGNVGKALIATGLLLFGFVAYQLWGTGIETARAQNTLENQFEAGLAEANVDLDSIPVTAAAADTSTGGPVEGAPSDDVGNDPAVRPEDRDAPDLGSAEISSGDQIEAGLPQIPDADITRPVAVDLSDVAVEQPVRAIVSGEVLARLEIPRIGRTDYIVPGVSLNALKKGPGHYPDTPLPGQLGNAAIAGHRTTYGAPFFDVDQLRAGDEMVVTYTNGDRFVYEVTFTEIVSAADYYVVTTSDPNIAEMTLTSCHPKYTARDRIVVHSVLNPAKSSNVGVSTFYELETDVDEQPIPGDDPVLTADEAEPAIDASGTEVTERESTLVDSPADDVDVVDEIDEIDEIAEPADATTEDAEAVATGGQTDQPDRDATTAIDDEPTPVDAFSQGWFDDRDAFLQIALWGLALTIISLLAYQVSKKYRRDSIGFLVGIAPFLVALYFFFQNINRLLPPGI